MAFFDLITYNEARQIRNHLALVHGDQETLKVLLDPALTPASFATWLSAPGNLALVTQFMAVEGAVSAMVANSVAMAAVIANGPALAAMTSSSAAMQAVTSSSAAMQAVTSSSAAMAAIASSSVAMSAFISSRAALDAVFAIPSAKAAFKGATALPLATIPVMTGLTAPSGVASALTSHGSYPAWKAFNKTPSDYWSATVATNQWLCYRFPTPVFIHSVGIQSNNSSTAPKNFRIEYSDDIATWVIAADGVNPSSTAVTNYDVRGVGKHLYWRLFMLDTYGGTTAPNISELTLGGFA